MVNFSSLVGPFNGYFEFFARKTKVQAYIISGWPKPPTKLPFGRHELSFGRHDLIIPTIFGRYDILIRQFLSYQLH